MTLKFRFVFFDVDSTLVTIEGIDVLANNNPEIVALTDAAMNGELTLEEVYAKRLDLIRPHRNDVTRLAEIYRASLVTGVRETFAALHAAGAQIHLVTAGITQAVLPLAAELAIPEPAVHAVTLRFAPDGTYEDFDRRTFLTRGGGKELVVRDVRARAHGKAVLIGDGISDLEATPAVDLFIGFGGVQKRPRVREAAAVYIEESDMRAILPIVLEQAP